MKNQRLKYEEQAATLAKAVDIAGRVIKESAEFDANLAKQMLNFGAHVKQSVLNPEPRFKRLASLKQSENEFLTFWNESSGPQVEKFWSLVHENKLGYLRKDVINDVLRRKKIKSIHEFDTVTDNIVVYEQIGRINKQQVIELNNYLGEFEKRKRLKL